MNRRDDPNPFDEEEVNPFAVGALSSLSLSLSALRCPFALDTSFHHVLPRCCGVTRNAVPWWRRILSVPLICVAGCGVRAKHSREQRSRCLPWLLSALLPAVGVSDRSRAHPAAFFLYLGVLREYSLLTCKFFSFLL